MMKRMRSLLMIILGLSCCTSPGMGQTPVKIMPLGNSITRGETDGTITVDQMKGYRYDLKQMLTGAGYSIDYVGSESSGCSYFSDCEHAGIGGSRDQYVARLLMDGYDERNGVQILVPPRPYLDDFNPDIILLHIGTNDITHEADAITNQQVSVILNLIDQYEVRVQKEVLVFLALIINRKLPCVAGSGCQTTIDFNNVIESMALARIANGDKIVIVDMEHDAGFNYDATDMADNLHPNAAGYAKMGSLWYSSIIDNYNTAPYISPIPDQNFPEGETSDAIHLDNFVNDLESIDQNISWTFTQTDTPNLTITIDAERLVTATPKDPDWYGSEIAVFTATDQGKNGKYIKSFSDTVVFTVTPANDPPFFISTPVLSVDKGQQYIYSYNASDVDPGDNLEFSIFDSPSWLTLYPTSKLLAGIPEHAGLYPITLRVTDGQVNIDQLFTVQVIGSTGIHGNKDDQPVVLFPNPATDNIMLKITDQSEDLEFLLLDLTGQPVLRKTICKHCTTEIDLKESGLASGFYLYRITGSTSEHIGKLLIK